MIKSITIGRDAACEVRVSDSLIEVSRRHAIISVNGTKVTITDTSRNGTYINGIRINRGIPVPVQHGDVVSLAHSYTLDWEAFVPKSSIINQRNILIIISAVVILLIIFLLKNIDFNITCSDNNDPYYNNPAPQQTEQTDSTEIKRKEAEKAERDSILMKKLDEFNKRSAKPTKPSRPDTTGKKNKNIQPSDSSQVQGTLIL